MSATRRSRGLVSAATPLLTKSSVKTLYRQCSQADRVLSARDADSRLQPTALGPSSPQWPPGFTAHIRHAFTDHWHGCEDALEAAVAVDGPRYRQAFDAGDPEQSGIWFGEAAGAIHSIEPAAMLVEWMVADAAAQLRCYAGAEARVKTTGFHLSDHAG
jgi:hypothetical protein